MTNKDFDKSFNRMNKIFWIMFPVALTLILGSFCFYSYLAFRFGPKILNTAEHSLNTIDKSLDKVDTDLDAND